MKGKRGNKITVIITGLAVAAGLFVMAGRGIGEEESIQQRFAREKEAAIEDGRIDCCLQHPCSQCFAETGYCPCAENLRQGNPVCQECKGGWEAGDGAIEGIEPEEVQTMPRGG